MVARPFDTTGRGVQGVRGDTRSRLRAAGGHERSDRGSSGARDMRYRLDVVAPTVLDAVQFAGGWLFDRVMAGWDVTVLIPGDEDVRPLEILGPDTLDLESALESAEERPIRRPSRSRRVSSAVTSGYGAVCWRRSIRA